MREEKATPKLTLFHQIRLARLVRSAQLVHKIFSGTTDEIFAGFRQILDYDENLNKKPEEPAKMLSLANVANVSIADSKKSAQSDGSKLSEARSRKMELKFLLSVNLCDLNEVKMQLRGGVDANAMMNDGSEKTALHLACEHMSPNYFPIVVALLRSGAR